MKAAVIGIGSNSVRMLMAQVGDGRFVRLMRDREGTRLFAGLDAEGNLTQESMRKTADAVVRMVRRARENRCDCVHIFATSASRDARNGEIFLSLLRHETGLEPEIISGEEEAALSFIGAAELAEGRCGMVDIGGGSTELVFGTRAAMECALSFQMGAVRLFQELPLRCRADMARVEEAAAAILTEKWHTFEAPPVPDLWIGTGGTFTALGAMVRGISWTNRTQMHGTRIERERAREIGSQLADMTLEERLRLPGLQPQRADIVVHGICILLAIMDYFRIPAILVSEYGNLDGYLIKNHSA